MAEDPLAVARFDADENQQTLDLARAAVDRLAHDLDVATAEAASLRVERERLAADVDTVLGSRSWRLTEPLRRVRRSVGPRRSHADDASTPTSETDDRDAAAFERRMAVAYAEAAARFPTTTPLSFTHKVWHRRLLDRRPVLPTLVDKVAVRDVIAERVGEEYLPRLVTVLDDVSSLDSAALPTTFAARSTHGSGGLALVHDGGLGDLTDAEPWWRGAYPSTDVPWDEVRRRFSTVLGLDYGWDQLEWAYLGLPRRILVEELLRGADGGRPVEYLVFVFDGVPRLSAVVGGRFVEQWVAYRTTDWHPLRSGPDYTRTWPTPVRPAAWDEMLEVAAELGRGLDMVRVDLYETDRGVRVGELTLYPAAGNAVFEPAVDDLVRGALWRLPDLATLGPGEGPAHGTDPSPAVGLTGFEPATP